MLANSNIAKIWGKTANFPIEAGPFDGLIGHLRNPCDSFSGTGPTGATDDSPQIVGFEPRKFRIPEFGRFGTEGDAAPGVPPIRPALPRPVAHDRAGSAAAGGREFVKKNR